MVFEAINDSKGRLIEIIKNITNAHFKNLKEQNRESIHDVQKSINHVKHSMNYVTH